MAARKNEREVILDQLSNLDTQTLALAYAYARYLVEYGVDVTEKWETAVRQMSELEKAERKGYYEGLKRASTPS